MFKTMQCPKTAGLLRGFEKFEYVYAKALPSGIVWSQVLESIAAEEIGRPIRRSEGHNSPLNIHGGGGVTGKPLFLPWTFQAYLDYFRKTGYMLPIWPDYLKMPESDGTAILCGIRDMLNSFFNELQSEVTAINPHLEVNYLSSILLGDSFGGTIACMISQLPILQVRPRPPNFQWRAIYLRCAPWNPLVSVPGIEITQDIAYRTAKEILSLRESMPWAIPRGATTPPHAMIMGPTARIAERYPDMWKIPWPNELCKDAVAGQAQPTKVMLCYRGADKIVPLQYAYDLCGFFKGCPGVDVDLMIYSGKAHNWGYNELLGDD
ncbi:hypothetical protein GQ44DRAFT_780939 [Phaeosphaeriaceae sp. PMI808]|nr:hypothetical protein GQ44DRAFT_780939 [Phaeosphaeriaceae sp. PMI808]